MQTILRTIFLSAVALAATAAPVVTLDPVVGSITGYPGQTLYWTASVEPDTNNWISFTGSALLNETSPAIGLFLDLIGLQGGPDGGVLPPGNGPWITQAGSYVIGALAPVGAVNTATLRLLYEEFSANPFTCGDCLVGSNYIDVNVQIEVTATPEPSSQLLAGAALALIASRATGARRRRVAPLRRTS